MDWLPEFSEEDKEVLVKIVKAAQGRKVEGTKGDWKQFLKKESDKYSMSHDPARHPWTTLAAFLKTIVRESDKRMVCQRISALKRAEKIKEFKGKSTLPQALVELTNQHWRYKEYYTFPSSTEGWVTTERNKGNSSSEHEEYMVSIDCEMALCEDGEREVVRACVVNSDCKTMLDMYIKPRKVVIDYLTPITGISEADLENVTSSLSDLQTAILELVSSSTIFVGHSLHNDLQALKIDHLRVIDTSLIFQYQNRPDSYSVGLNSLCKAVLGYHFRDDEGPHDCLKDAIIPMQIVLNILEHGLDRPIIIEDKKLSEGELCKLYLHGIPCTVTVKALKHMFAKRYTVKIEEISWTKSNSGTTFAVFKSVDDANKAFEHLKGPVGLDSFGRPQKAPLMSVVGKDGKRVQVSIKVRKMASISYESAMLDNAPSSEGRNLVSAKRRKLMDGNGGTQMDCCCGNLEELKSAKDQLRIKMEEVHTFQKKILDLTRD